MITPYEMYRLALWLTLLLGGRSSSINAWIPSSRPVGIRRPVARHQPLHRPSPSVPKSIMFEVHPPSTSHTCINQDVVSDDGHSMSRNSNYHNNNNNNNNRRHFLQSATTACSTAILTIFGGTSTAHAVGPVKIALTPVQYSAVICPPDRPIPGEKAMIGMRGLCVTVRAKLDGMSPKALDKVGVYGFVTDGESGDSVLANNPDGGTDAGQFAMIESVTPQDTTITFEFIAAVPRDKDLSIYDNGIGPLNFSSLRLISYPGGQQFGAISPCEMNEFSDECEAWERDNGPYQKAEFMVKSNPRTKGS